MILVINNPPKQMLLVRHVISVSKHLTKNLQRERFLLAHGLVGFCPWVSESVCFDRSNMWRRRLFTSWWTGNREGEVWGIMSDLQNHISTGLLLLARSLLKIT